MKAEPGFGEGPVSIRGTWGDAEHVGRLIAGQARKVAQLDEFGLDRIMLDESVQGLI